MASPRLQPSDSDNSFSEERLKLYVDVLKKANPMLHDLAVSVKEEDVKHFIEADDFENKELIAKKTTVTVKPKYILYSNGAKEISESIDFFGDESLGTVKLFTVLPHLYDVLDKGGVLVLDEVENGLHLDLVRSIIALFIDEESNKHKAQLICTTHQPLLVDKNTRRDQVWITCKDEFGKSSLHRLSNRSTSRAKVNITNKLLEGAFGCNPEAFFQ
jgi:AAA15 family ATPase/GTPase